MTFIEAIRKIEAGELKEGDIIRWQGSYNSDAKQFSGGYLYIIENNKIVGKSINGVKNRSEAIKKYREKKSEKISNENHN